MIEEEETKLRKQLIAPNGTILREAPLLIGPKQVSAPLCLGCHLHTAELMPCSRCGWPVCSPACAASRNHLPECTLSSRCRRTKLDPAKLSSSPYMLGCIIVLRALYLKETNAEAWKQLMSLQSHSAARRVMDKHDLDSVNVVAFIRDFLRLRDYDSDLMDEIIGIVDTNAFVVPRMDICAIYHRASMAEHSCLFNTVQTFDEDLVLTLKAVREIKPGEPVTICYTDPLWGTRNRRFHLAETKLFDCLCERCRDPFELGTNLSSLKCSKCAKGSLVNVTPLVEPGKWACVCGHEVTWLEAERVLGKFGERLSKLEDKVGKCEAFIEDCLSAGVRYLFPVMSVTKVQLFYDVLSPYSWFALETICRYRTLWNMSLEMKPALLSAVVSKAGNSPPGLVPNKMKYMCQDLLIGAEYFDVPLKLISDPSTTFFQKGSMRPMRFLTAIYKESPEKLESVSRQLWMRIWSRDEDMVAPESIAAAGKAAGLSDEEVQRYLAATETDAVKEALKDSVAEVLDAGGFGLPFFIVGEGSERKIFFGSDRFPQMAFVMGESWRGPVPLRGREVDGKL
ncbi:unnamed protein product [Notodromas monacha]|uniref:Glutathione S-transferase kappa 1 n=1 Tax=Notodromas monacha TaxID=399045 RepID=A0A7R9GJ05_9CRUS|nr:unnamed protein product [Notodromas monacha]CAG0924374.1 unnamed protein product [Notodromas monacha]